MATNVLIDNDITFDTVIKNIVINKPYEYIYNCLVTIIISKMFDIDDKTIRYELYNFKNEKHRLEKIILKNNITLIDETYNASLDSVISSVKYLSSFKLRKILVLADILELGKMSKDIHKKIGNSIKDIDILITIGRYSKIIGKLNKNIWYKHFKDEKKARSYIKDSLKKDDVILIKGSNGMKLINIVNYLKDE